MYKVIYTVHHFTIPLGKSRYTVKRQYERVNVKYITLVHISVHTGIKARIFIVILSEFERSSLFIICMIDWKLTLQIIFFFEIGHFESPHC